MIPVPGFRRRAVPPPEPRPVPAVFAPAWPPGFPPLRPGEPGPDPRVFGPRDAGRLQNGGMCTSNGTWRSCPCGVTWRGETGCWACGGTGAEW